MKKASVIWDIDDEDIYAVIDEMTVYRAAETLGIPTIIYANMTTKERHDYIDDLSRFEKQEIMNLPDEVDIPDDITDEDDISEWLSDEYGFCHLGFKLYY